jgi:succinate dehydrogenase / fumarate reductase, membrane anchor subunit
MASQGKDAAALRVDVMRSQLGRVRGLGAAKSGVHAWWQERVTSIALVPLTLWFIAVVLTHIGADRAAIAHWASRPFNSVLLLALVITTFHHMALGLQVVIEDYIHGEVAKSLSLLAMKAACALFGLAAVLAVLKLAF